jgi:hypothetical protein
MAAYMDADDAAAAAAAAAAAESDDEHEEDEEDEEDEAEEAVGQLRRQLQAYPQHYDTHVALIAALRAAGRAEELRHARTRLAEMFPLTEGVCVCVCVCVCVRTYVSTLAGADAGSVRVQTYGVCGSWTRWRAWPRPRTAAAWWSYVSVR